jgi:hypothetical protein
VGDEIVPKAVNVGSIRLDPPGIPLDLAKVYGPAERKSALLAPNVATGAQSKTTVG